ncbi:ABC transporter permease [Pseudooceanicola nitratireducens]|uniref:ABC transporter permease n=1 Tax=Pseudooceanicola nitratireducens TaxID=517719 RepID=UPI001C95A2F5|nr:ABC transporter permease [Pseudooceanicola nitratireducens]MBY6158108.1 ABC transporter permease [Pseudooceanicola nitratireducens]
MRKDWIVAALSLVCLVALWALASAVKADPLVLPSPRATLTVWAELAARGELWIQMRATLIRVAIAFTLAMGLGSVIGILLGRHPGADRFFGPWVTVFLNIPALVVIVLCYLWIGLNETAAIAAVTLNKVAQVITTLRDGTRATNSDHDDMAQVFGMSRMAHLRHVLLPQLAPFFAVAARNGLAMIWKIVLVVEFLGRSSGIGFKIHLHFQNFQTAHVLAYALTFVTVMLAIEMLVIRRWEEAAGRWRGSA